MASMTAPSVSDRQSARGPPGRPHTLTFVFTDIEGSTRLLEHLRDRYALVLADHEELVRAEAARWDGELVDTHGDAFFLVFTTSTAAVSFAAGLQRALAEHPWPEGVAVRLRIGVHTGLTTRSATGYVGLDIHRAARIAAVGHGGQVLVSAEAASGLAVERLGGAKVRPLGRHRVKDFAEPVTLHQLVIPGLPADFPPPRSTDATDEPPAPGESPYLGLAHFEEADADRFFGRQQVVARLLTRLAEQPFLAVIGASGSGKSSLLRAGLIPGLRARGRRLVVLTPTAEPLSALADGLLEGTGSTEERSRFAAQLRAAPETLTNRLDRGAVVMVDQAEELFSRCRDDDERAAFVACLLAGLDAGLSVLIALRADFYDRLAAHPALRDMVAATQEYLGPMTADELEEAITGPAEAGGWRFAPGLVELIIHDVGAEPGALPLLSHALHETWQRRRGSTMTLRGYLDAGGVQGAIARSADRLMAELTPSGRDAARAILLRLTELGSGTPDTRRHASLEELLVGPSHAEARAVLDRLAAARLIVVSADSAEVAHEALIREWPTLRQWLDTDREGLRLHRALTQATADWERAGRDASLLFRGARLAAALDWAAEHEAELNPNEHEFLNDSRLATEREANRQRRISHRLRALLAGTAVLLVVAMGAGAFAAIQANRAEEEAGAAGLAAERAEREEARAEQEANAARRAEDIARSRELAASAINALDDDPSLAKLLALSAASIAEPPLEVISALHRAHAADLVIARYRWPEDSYLWTDLDPSGRLLVASGSAPFDSGDYLEVANLASEEVLWSHRVALEALSIGPAHFSSDGQTVVAGVYWEPTEGDDGPAAEDFRGALGVHVWEATTGELIDHFDLGRCGGIVADLSETRLLVRTRADAVTECWRLSQPFGAPSFEFGVELIDIGSGERQSLTSKSPIFHDDFVSLSGDGRYVAFEDWTIDPPIGVVLDLQTGERVLEWDALATGAVNPGLRQMNHDGSLLLEGLRPIQVWDVARGQVIASLDLDLGAFAVFGPSGRSVYSTGRDGTLRRWDATSGEEVWAVQGVGGGRVSVPSEGLVLVSDPEAGGAALVDARVRGEVGAVETCRGGWLPAAAQSLNVAGGVAAFHGACAEPGEPLTAHVIDLDGPALLDTIANVTGQVIRLSPDGTRLAGQQASATLNGPIVVREMGSGEELVELEGLCWWNGDLSLTGVPREETGDCRPLPEPPFPVWARGLEWSPDGAMIAAVDDWAGEGSILVWEAQTGSLLFTGLRAGHIAFTVDSQHLLISPFGEPSLMVLSTESWEVVDEVALDPQLEGLDSLGLVGYGPDGRTLVAVGGLQAGGGGTLHWFDAETLEWIRSQPRIHEGSPKSVALSPDRSLLATGASDGFVRVWDTQTGRLLHEIPLGNTQVQGVAFVNERHLAVTPLEGNLLIFTIDTEELIEIVRASLTRGFTVTECERYNFLADCPTLEDLRVGDASGDP